MFDVDPNSLDPELRTARFLNLASAALGVMSLCLAIVPVCGGVIYERVIDLANQQALTIIQTGYSFLFR